MTETERLCRESIHALLVNYVWCADFGDLEALVALFGEEAMFEMKGRVTLVGRSALRHALVEGFGITPAQRAAQRTAGPMRHHLSSVKIILDTDSKARAWSYFAAIGPHGLDHWGRYTDQLRADRDGWLFASRRVSVDGCHSDSAFAVYREPATALR